jgi:TonB family protein
VKIYKNTPDLPINESEFVKNVRTMIASKNADFEEKYQELKNRPNHKFIGVKTKESHYSKYMDDWVKKIRQIGANQKPPKALKKKLKGSLIVQISFRPDGTLYGIEILESSKNSALDEYTLQVARMSAPFKPFEKDKKIFEELGKNGILNIVRRWNWDLSAYLPNEQNETVLTIE